MGPSPRGPHSLLCLRRSRYLPALMVSTLRRLLAPLCVAFPLLSIWTGCAPKTAEPAPPPVVRDTAAAPAVRERIPLRLGVVLPATASLQPYAEAVRAGIEVAAAEAERSGEYRVALEVRTAATAQAAVVLRPHHIAELGHHLQKAAHLVAIAHAFRVRAAINRDDQRVLLR